MKKILQILSNHVSYDQIRILGPLNHIQSELKSKNIAISVMPINQITPEIVRQYDRVCYHGCPGLAVYPLINESKVCLWVDDLMTDLPISNPAASTAQEIEGLKYLYKNAASVVTTTPWLAQHIQTNYGRPCLTAPNLIDISWQNNLKQSVIYSFGNSHAGDLRLLNDLKTDRDVYFFGHTLPETFCDYHRNDKGLIHLYPNKKNIFHIPVETDWEKYQIAMMNLNYGVGLIPLEDNEFNKAKSILKFGEYLARGAISVASNIGALQGIPDDAIIKINTMESCNDAWECAIERAFFARANTYLSAFEWWTENYSWITQKQQWIKTYENL